MKKSPSAYPSRTNVIRFSLPDTVLLTDGVEKVKLIAIALIDAGYTGIKIDSHRTENGQYYQELNVNIGTLEGQLVSLLELTNSSDWPSPEKAVKIVRAAYETNEGGQQ